MTVLARGSMLGIAQPGLGSGCQLEGGRTRLSKYRLQPRGLRARTRWTDGCANAVEGLIRHRCRQAPCRSSLAPSRARPLARSVQEEELPTNPLDDELAPHYRYGLARGYRYGIALG